MLTDRLGTMLVLSAVIAAASAVLGHVSALVVPGWFGFRSVSTAGMMALSAGLLFLTAGLFAPRQGVIVRAIRRRRMSFDILCEDIVAILYRMEESGRRSAPPSHLMERLFAGNWSLRMAIWLQQRRGLLASTGNEIHLTDHGRHRGSDLVRSHRLWEHYLATEAGVAVDRLHGHAERFEHVTGRELRDRLQTEAGAAAIDPHGQPIPEESDSTTDN